MITAIDSWISQKVKTLWEERNMVSFCKACNTSDKQAKLIQDIISQIQYVIYDIDSKFEENMGNDVSKLTEICLQWKVAIEKILNVYKYEIDDSFIQPLLDFQDMEIDMRMYADDPTVKTPLDYPIDDFYRLKSCDIFLNRKIVTTISWNESLYTSDVVLFDQLWEVLDDMMDVEEDINAINSNRFFFFFVQKWVEETVKEYYNFVIPSLKIIMVKSKELSALWLDVVWLNQQLMSKLCSDWNWVTMSKTNEMLFGK